MTKAWGGILPPPRGQGYFTGESPFDSAGFVHPAESWWPHMDGEAIEIDHFVDGFLRQRLRIEEEAITTTVVQVLRAKGWTVEPPAVPRPPFDEAAARENLSSIRTMIDDLQKERA